MKASELRSQDPKELRQELEKLRRELFDLDFQWQADEKPDTSVKGKIRRDIARILTVLHQREAAPESAEPAAE